MTVAPPTGSPAPAFLNHFYMVLDSSTYEAVETDDFLRNRFAVNEKRTTTNAEITYTGLYFYGLNTYFEFFDVRNSPRDRVGDSGLAFGVDQPGAIKVLQEKLGSSLAQSLKPVTRLHGEKQIPWFSMLTAKNLPYESELSCWVMEYHPDFLAEWNAQPKGTNRGIARSEILQRYCEILAPVDKPVLEDVIGLTVAADARTTSSLIDFCDVLGYRVEKNGNEIALHGPNFVMLLIPATESLRGIREIKMRTRNQGEKEHRLGKSTLRFDGSSASWSFR